MKSILLLLLFSAAVQSTIGAKEIGIFEGVAVPGRTVEPPAEAIRGALEARGLRSEIIRADAFVTSASFAPERYGVLIVPQCELFPEAALTPLLQYLRSGGRMLLIGGPPFGQLTVRFAGQWLTGEMLEKRRERGMPLVQTLLSFSPSEQSRWRHATGDRATTARISVEENQGRKARDRYSVLHPDSPLRDISWGLRVDVARYRNWDSVWRDFEAAPLPNDPRVLTAFRAKGSAGAKQLMVEWREKDGSRWIAVIDLAPEWRNYALPVERFKYWSDSPAKGRGGPGDRLHPGDAVRLTLAIAASHTPAVAPGDHTYWLADLGWAVDDLPRLAAEPPRLEMLSPWYKTYRTSIPCRLDPTAMTPSSGTKTAWDGVEVISPVARTRGLGFDASREYRWIPLAAARDQAGVERGVAASLLVWRSGEFARGAWGYIGIDDRAWMQRHRAPLLEWIAAMSGMLDRGLWMAQGGIDPVCRFEDEPWSFRAELLNRTDVEVGATVRVAIQPVAPESSSGTALNLSVPRIAPNSSQVVEWKDPPSALSQKRATGLYRVETAVKFVVPPLGGTDERKTPPKGGTTNLAEGSTTNLAEGGTTNWQSIDTIVQEVRVVARNRTADPRRLVRVRGGDFEIDGKPWVPYGINFWPGYVAGAANNEWLAAGVYDPARVQADLERVAAHGMNVVCVQFYSESQARPLLDFLERCRALGLYAFVSVPGAHPLNPNPGLLQQTIRAGHLAASDAVFAYDLAWEPHVGDESARGRYDGPWRDWIAERYGGTESAERDWGFRAPRDGQGRPAGPTNAQILNDGPHRVMVAAYRRFLDDQISYGYGVVARAIREVDPHHLLGVRTGYGGNGFPGIDPQMPFDLASGAKHLDFISPEGYSFGPEWESVRRAGLVTQYARRVGGGKPVWWAEYGLTIYSPSDERVGPGQVANLYHARPDQVGDPYPARPDLAARQRDLYVNFARMFVESRANGGAGWWLPGGYRIGENSDYGIFNPDGTARPAALAIREWAPRIGAIRAPESKADVVIRIDRDLHPRGFSQIRAQHAEEYARAVEAGRSVALATSGTGTNSANASLVAVGNRPYNGANPPKYLNAEFERFWVKIGEGPWREARDGDRIAVPRGTSVFGRAEVANTGEAAWVAPKEGAAPPVGEGAAPPVGSVRLVTARGSELPLRSGAPLAADTPFLKTGEFRDFEIAGDVKRDATIELELEAAARARFGRHFRLRLEVEPVGKP